MGEHPCTTFRSHHEGHGGNPFPDNWVNVCQAQYLAKYIQDYADAANSGATMVEAYASANKKLAVACN